jgi:hypothetical protein
MQEMKLAFPMANGMLPVFGMMNLTVSGDPGGEEGRHAFFDGACCFITR